MARMNWKAIALNLSEAREELERLETFAADPKRRNDGEFMVGMAHAYHHLNFAWNIRLVPMSEYANLGDADFNRWGRFPRDLPLMLSAPERRRSSNRSLSNKRLQRTGASAKSVNGASRRRGRNGARR